MKIHIVAVGNKMPFWVDEAFLDYAKRMPNDYALVLKEIKPESRNQGKSTDQIMALEGKRIHDYLGHIPYYALDEHGVNITSVGLAETLENWQQNHQDIGLVIGGADGLAPHIKEQACGLIRLSSMTLAHGMVRVLLAEQLYRAWSIITNHPYHRA